MSIRAKTRGFTLVELVVVIVIIALLVPILILGCSKAMKLDRGGKRAQCMANLKGIGNAIGMYRSDSRGSYPYIYCPEPMSTDTGPNREVHACVPRAITASLWLLVRRKQPTAMFVCPSTDDVPDPDPGETPEDYFDFSSNKNVSYSYQSSHPQSLSSKAATGIPASAPSGLVIVADQSPQTGSADETTEANRKANLSQNHGAGEEINFLLADGSVRKSNSQKVGVDNDPIYVANGRTEKDSYLIGPMPKK